MSIPPSGWEQSVQPAPAQPSPSECSTPLPDSSAEADSTEMHVGAPLSSAAAAHTSSSHTTGRGFLHIVRHGAGQSAVYVVTYRRLDHLANPKPVLAEDARMLIELLERLGVDLQLSEVRGALKDILRLGSANIPGVWLSDELMAEKGLVED